VTIDAHKQMWLPMGSGMVLFRDPQVAQVVRKSANYIIRSESHDLGKFTIDGSRPAHAIFLQANMRIFGLRGFEVLFDRTVRVAKYMARKVMQSTDFELLVKPMTNILLYRWVPLSMREKYWDRQLTDEDNDYIDKCNRELQDVQKLKGKCFVSRTTIKCPLYNHRPVVGLRVVIGNPLTTEADIDAVIQDQLQIIKSGEVTEDFAGSDDEAVVRQVGAVAPDIAQDDADITFKYWTKFWDSMSDAEKCVFHNSIETFFDSLITPDCLISDPGLPPAEAMQVAVAKALNERSEMVL